MRLERLFNVLVVQGALLTAGVAGGAAGGCDVEGDPPDSSSGGDASTTEGAGASTGPGEATGTAGPAESSGAATQSASADDGATDGGSTGGGSTESDSGTGSGSGSTGPEPGDGSSGPPLECSEPAEPFDPCGCPCCWVQDCVNTDACCEGWSECVGM